MAWWVRVSVVQPWKLELDLPQDPDKTNKQPNNILSMRCLPVISVLGETDKKILGDSWMTSYFTQETELRVQLEVLSQRNRVDHDRAFHKFIYGCVQLHTRMHPGACTTHRHNKIELYVLYNKFIMKVSDARGLMT